MSTGYWKDINCRCLIGDDLKKYGIQKFFIYEKNNERSIWKVTGVSEYRRIYRNGKTNGYKIHAKCVFGKNKGESVSFVDRYLTLYRDMAMLLVQL